MIPQSRIRNSQFPACPLAESSFPELRIEGVSSSWLNRVIENGGWRPALTSAAAILRGTSALFTLLRLNQVATESIEGAQIVVDVFVLVQLVLFSRSKLRCSLFA